MNNNLPTFTFLPRDPGLAVYTYRVQRVTELQTGLMS